MSSDYMRSRRGRERRRAVDDALGPSGIHQILRSPQVSPLGIRRSPNLSSNQFANALHLRTMNGSNYPIIDSRRRSTSASAELRERRQRRASLTISNNNELTATSSSLMNDEDIHMLRWEEYQHIVDEVDRALVHVDDAIACLKDDEQGPDIIGRFISKNTSSLERLNALSFELHASKDTSLLSLKRRVWEAKIDIFRGWMMDIAEHVEHTHPQTGESLIQVIDAYDVLFCGVDQHIVTDPQHLVSPQQHAALKSGEEDVNDEMNQNHRHLFELTKTWRHIQRLISAGAVILDLPDIELIYAIESLIRASIGRSPSLPYMSLDAIKRLARNAIRIPILDMGIAFYKVYFPDLKQALISIARPEQSILHDSVEICIVVIMFEPLTTTTIRTNNGDDDDGGTFSQFISLRDRMRYISVTKQLCLILADPQFKHDLLTCSSRQELELLLARYLGSLMICLSHHHQSTTHPNTSTSSSSSVQPFDDGLHANGSLKQDIDARIKLYVSDWYDGWNMKCIFAIASLLLSCLPAAFVFGTLIEDRTNGMMGVSETLLATSCASIVFALFAGQPLIIVGATGPVAMFIIALYDLCQSFHIDFLQMYACVGIWTCLFLVVAAFLHWSCWMRRVTRFTDDIFSALIAFVYLSEPIREAINTFTNSPPDQSMFTILLLIVTIYLASLFRNLRLSRYFYKCIRLLIADLAIVLAIIAASLLAYSLRHKVDVHRPKVPRVGTTSGRAWLETIELCTSIEWTTILFSIVPAFFLTVLLFLEHNLTARLVHQKNHKLTKRGAPHLDLLILGVLVFLCSWMGVPWMVGEPLRSMGHIHSLATFQTECAPCEYDMKRHVHHHHRRLKHVILSVRETRFSALVVGILMFLLWCVIAPLIKQVPSIVLGSVLFHMGFVSLHGNHLIDRVKLFFMDPSFWKHDHHLRMHTMNQSDNSSSNISSRMAVSSATIHMFTLIQLVCVALLITVESTSLAITFPLVVAALVPLRSFLKRKVLSQPAIERLDPIEIVDPAVQLFFSNAQPRDKQRKDMMHKGVAEEMKDELRSIQIDLPNDGLTSMGQTHCSGSYVEHNVLVNRPAEHQAGGDAVQQSVTIGMEVEAGANHQIESIESPLTNRLVNTNSI